MPETRRTQTTPGDGRRLFGVHAVLAAERQHQQARIGVIQAQAARYADTAALFQALGGGWWNRQPDGGLAARTVND